MIGYGIDDASLNGMTIPRYGMKHHTIKYWQDQAKDLYRYNGIYAGRSTIEKHINDASSRGIGYDIISFAAVASREHLIAVLTKTRGNRWK